ncbi:MAG TPA: GNAT family N-acetyltransferase [Cellulomonadaceae bacterium]|nr:GNAT family N-acetyltransferase [Cellulomonadaceae bacterium]
MRHPACQMVNEPGVHGLLSFSDDSPARLLVTDDTAEDVLTALLPSIGAGAISIFAAAPRCTELVTNHQGWQPKAVTAMINSDLRAVPEGPLPSGLTLRPVRRLAEDPTDAVPLKDALAAVRLANPSIDDAPQALAEHLRSLPPTTRLFAAVDDDGVVRATSGFGTFGAQGTVFFVNTDPSWRHRGIGQAMTAAALRSARHAGASQACLDASDAAISIYLRLGFEIVARSTQFFRAG